MICCGMRLKSGQGLHIRCETLIRTYQERLDIQENLSRVGLGQNKSCVDKVFEFESKKAKEAKVKRREDSNCMSSFKTCKYQVIYIFELLRSIPRDSILVLTLNDFIGIFTLLSIR